MKTTEGLLADFLTQAEAAVALRICKRTLERWRRLGEGRQSARSVAAFCTDDQASRNGSPSKNRPAAFRTKRVL